MTSACYTEWVKKKETEIQSLKAIGPDRSLTGDYMWTLPSCARRVIRARSLLAPESWREYPARTSLVSPLHTGVVSHHARSTLISQNRKEKA